MGGVFSKPKAPPPKPDPAIEEARKAALEKEQATYKDKVARGIIGSRSLFGRAGGRGFFG